MATQKTPNYGLNKPDENEFYNISIQNENMDILDTQLKEVFENAGTKINFKDEIPAEPLPREADRLGGHPASYFATQTDITETQDLVSTMLPLTGGTMSGSITIQKDTPILHLAHSITNRKVMLTSEGNGNGVVYNTKQDGSAGHYLVIYPETASLAASLSFIRIGTGEYKIFGEHNLTISTAAPSSALAEGSQHQVY